MPKVVYHVLASGLMETSPGLTVPSGKKKWSIKARVWSPVLLPLIRLWGLPLPFLT